MVVPPRTFFLAESANVLGLPKRRASPFSFQNSLCASRSLTASKVEGDSVGSAPATHHVFGTRSLDDQA
jgi:hypothetical protein